MSKLVYTKHKTWDYVLDKDYTLYVKNIDFGKFKAYGVGDYSGKLLIEGCGDHLIIHAGYAWDGCTGVPSYDWNLEASLVHDAMYQIKKCPNGDLCKVSWYQVDRLFLNMMKAAGANWLQRRTYYTGVRTFGFFFKFNKLDSLKIVAA